MVNTTKIDKIIELLDDDYIRYYGVYEVAKRIASLDDTSPNEVSATSMISDISRMAVVISSTLPADVIVVLNTVVSKLIVTIYHSGWSKSIYGGHELVWYWDDSIDGYTTIMNELKPLYYLATHNDEWTEEHCR